MARYENQNGVLTVYFGDTDGETCSYTEPPVTRIIGDFGGVQLMSSAMISALVLLKKKADSDGVRFTLRAVGPTALIIPGDD